MRLSLVSIFMNFLIFSRNWAENPLSHKANCQVPHIWISISNSNESSANLPPNPFRLATLFLAFDDVDKNDHFVKGTKVISPEQAQQIVTFVSRWKNKVNLICVNCEAGISRSAGVAFALSMLLNGDDSGILSDKQYAPNNTVKDSILNSGKPLATDKTPRWYWSRWQEQDEQNTNPSRDLQQEEPGRNLSGDSPGEPKVRQ
jgi:predicted protein tyrosine phosphatase